MATATLLAGDAKTALDTYIAGLAEPKAANIDRDDIFDALFESVEHWVGVQDSLQSVSANTTLTKDSARTTKMTTGSTGRTVTLPVGSTCREGQRFRIFKVDSGTGSISLARQSTDTIDGTTSPTLLYSQYNYVEVEWVGGGIWTITPGGLKSNGSNSDGEFELLSNGVLNEWGSRTTTSNTNAVNQWGTTSGTTYYNNNQLSNFPLAFIAKPNFSVTTTSRAAGWIANGQATGTTQYQVVSHTGENSAGVAIWDWQAKGRWRT